MNCGEMSEQKISVLLAISNNTISELTGDKLPKNYQVLQLLFHYTKVKQLPLKESIQLVIKEVKSFWEKASINTRRNDRCCKKLDELYADYRSIQKCKLKKKKMILKFN